MILKELLGLENLSKAQALYINKEIEIIIIYKNKNLIFIFFQVIAPSLECFNNS